MGKEKNEKENENEKEMEGEKKKEKKEKASAEPKKLSKKDSPRDGHAEKKGPSPPTSAKLTSSNSASHSPNEETERTKEGAGKNSKVSKGTMEGKSIALLLPSEK